MLYASDYLTEENLFATLTESDVYKQSVELLSRFKDRRPVPKRNYDQFTAKLETSSKRAALLDFFGDVRGKRVLFLGDDDFTSVVTANIKSDQEVVVLDIDKRILDNIGGISDELDLGIKRIRHDLRKTIPSELKGRFDTVFTDPPYTPEGIRLFVSRAIEAIDRQNKTARVMFATATAIEPKNDFYPFRKLSPTQD